MVIKKVHKGFRVSSFLGLRWWYYPACKIVFGRTPEKYFNSKSVQKQEMAEQPLLLFAKKGIPITCKRCLKLKNKKKLHFKRGDLIFYKGKMDEVVSLHGHPNINIIGLKYNGQVSIKNITKNKKR
jgi:hypothetical protein